MDKPLLKWTSTVDVIPTGNRRGVKEIAADHAEEVCGEVQEALAREIAAALRGKEKRRLKVQVTSESIPVFYPVGSQGENDA